eukprot:4539422-Karenia_brevis.AAC.1
MPQVNQRYRQLAILHLSFATASAIFYGTLWADTLPLSSLMLPMLRLKMHSWHAENPNSCGLSK